MIGLHSTIKGVPFYKKHNIKLSASSVQIKVCIVVIKSAKEPAFKSKKSQNSCTYNNMRTQLTNVQVKCTIL